MGKLVPVFYLISCIPILFIAFQYPAGLIYFFLPIVLIALQNKRNFGFEAGKYFFDDIREGIYSWQSSWSLLEVGFLGLLFFIMFYYYWGSDIKNATTIEYKIMRLLKIYILFLIPYIPTFYIQHFIYALAILTVLNKKKVYIL